MRTMERRARRAVPGSAGWRHGSRWVAQRAAAFLIPLVPNDQIALDEVAVRGRVEPSTRVVTGTIGTAVKLPVGRIRVTGHAQVQYRCDGTFDGVVGYAWPLRVAARIKGVEIVTRLAGEVGGGSASACQGAAHAFDGKLAIRDTVLTGAVRIGDGSIALRGEVRRLTRTRWCASVTSHDSAGVTIRVDFIAREEDR